MTSSSTEFPAALVTDSVGAWFGARVRRTGADTCEVRIPSPAPGTGGSGFARVLQAVDIAAGVSACLAVVPGAAMTADIVMNRMPEDAVGDLVAFGWILRAGRAQIVARVDVLDEREVLVATATANHGVRPDGLRMYLHDLEPGDEFDLAPHRTAPLGLLAEVFYDPAGELPVNVDTANPWGVAQGALLTTLVEPAAREAGIARIEDLSVRFLASATAGPVALTSRSVADRAGNRLLQGNFFDRGAGRPVALVTVAGPRIEGEPR